MKRLRSLNFEEDYGGKKLTSLLLDGDKICKNPIK
jgi:hypothetical protein